MTDAHERITLPPISSFDITPSSKHHNHLRAGPSRRGSHFRGSSSWDGSSGGSNHPHNEFDDISYRCEALILCGPMLLTSKLSHAVRLLDPARVNTMLSTALIVATILPPGNRGTITLHILSQRSSLLHTSQSPRLCAPAAAVLLSTGAVSSYRQYPGKVGRVSPHAYRRENRRLILKPLFPPL